MNQICKCLSSWFQGEWKDSKQVALCERNTSVLCLVVQSTRVMMSAPFTGNVLTYYHWRPKVSVHTEPDRNQCNVLTAGVAEIKLKFTPRLVQVSFHVPEQTTCLSVQLFEMCFSSKNKCQCSVQQKSAEPSNLEIYVVWSRLTLRFVHTFKSFAWRTEYSSIYFGATVCQYVYVE